MIAPPKPLTPAQQALAEPNHALAYFVAKRYFFRYQRQPVLWDAILSAAALALVDAARRYNPNHVSPNTNQPVKFTTYATQTIWGVCNKLVIKFRTCPFKTCCLSNAFQKSDPDAPDSHSLSTGSELRAQIRSVLRFFGPTDRFLIRHRFGLHNQPELPLVEIGRRLGITRERCRQRWDAIVPKLQELCIRERIAV